MLYIMYMRKCNIGPSPSYIRMKNFLSFGFTYKEARLFNCIIRGNELDKDQVFELIKSIKRNYSTGNVKDNFDNDLSDVKNRQELFNRNYRSIRDILARNYYSGGEDVQREIEMFLYDDDKNYFLNNGQDDVKLNKKAFEILKSKYILLCKLLGYSENYLDNLKSKRESHKYLHLVVEIINYLGVEKVAGLLMSYFLGIISKENVYNDYGNNPDEDWVNKVRGVPTTVCYSDFGKKIFELYIFHKYLEYCSSINTKVKIGLSEFKTIKPELMEVSNESNFYFRIGGEFVASLKTLGLLTDDYYIDKNSKIRSHHYLSSDEYIRGEIVKDNLSIVVQPQRLPMVCEPSKYVYFEEPSLNKLGGYLLNDVRYTNKLIRQKVGYEISTELTTDSMILNLVNGVSSIPFKINTDTLNFVYKYGQSKNILIPESQDILDYFSKPREGTKIDIKLKSKVSKYLEEKNILCIGELYSKMDKIYFPVRLEFRTRLLCETVFFDYQKNDLAKGLISFARPGIISRHDKLGIMYFKAYGANMYGGGLDKYSLNYRIKWIDDNMERLLNFETNDIIDNSENKVCFVSFCYEYKRFIDFMNSKESLVFYTYIPIRLDASCNGYQHLALLTRQEELLSILNLDKSSYDEDPKDFYSYVRDVTDEYIKKEIIRLEDEYKVGKSVVELKQELFNLYNKIYPNSLDDLKVLLKSLNTDIEPNIDIFNLPVKKITKLKTSVVLSESLKNDIDVNKNKECLEVNMIKEQINIICKNIKKNTKDNIEISVLMDEVLKTEKDLKTLCGLKKLKDIKFDRSILKKEIMREGYNAQIPSLTDEIVKDLDAEVLDNLTYYTYNNNNNIKITRFEISLYIVTIKKVLSVLAPRISNLNKYLNSIAKICCALDMYIPWILPHKGAIIKSSYQVKEEVDLAAFSFTKDKYRLISFKEGKYDLGRQKRGFKPNLIHSLDASTIAMLYNMLKDLNIDMFTIHDCFAVTANHVPLLISKLKLVYKEMYSSSPYLLEFDKYLRTEINMKYGESVFPIDGNVVNASIINKKFGKLPFPDIKEVINLKVDLDSKIDNSLYAIN